MRTKIVWDMAIANWRFSNDRLVVVVVVGCSRENRNVAGCSMHSRIEHNYWSSRNSRVVEEYD